MTMPLGCSETVHPGRRASSGETRHRTAGLSVPCAKVFTAPLSGLSNICSSIGVRGRSVQERGRDSWRRWPRSGAMTPRTADNSVIDSVTSVRRPRRGERPWPATGGVVVARWSSGSWLSEVDMRVARDQRLWRQHRGTNRQCNAPGARPHGHAPAQMPCRLGASARTPRPADPGKQPRRPQRPVPGRVDSHHRGHAGERHSDVRQTTDRRWQRTPPSVPA